MVSGTLLRPVMVPDTLVCRTSDSFGLSGETQEKRKRRDVDVAAKATDHRNLS